MAPHVNLLLPPPTLAIAPATTRVSVLPAAGPRAPARAWAASLSCSPGQRGQRWRRLSVAAAAVGTEPGAGALRGRCGSTGAWSASTGPWASASRSASTAASSPTRSGKGDLVQGNAEKSRIIMVGDTLKKAGASKQGLVTIKDDLGDTEYGTSNVVYGLMT